MTPGMLQAGRPAPDFTLPGTADGPVTLSEAFRANRATILAFYVLDFTPG
ncbi:MAG: redoxin domain-containing protein [Candidatus Dormibacter sp.]|nr:MAG: hypothetical protein DLM66_04780 [Candidatus Dormibacteraeota bacterium]